MTRCEAVLSRRGAAWPIVVTLTCGQSVALTEIRDAVGQPHAACTKIRSDGMSHIALVEEQVRCADLARRAVHECFEAERALSSWSESELRFADGDR